MSIGLSYSIARSRESTEFRRLIDGSINFLRLPDPADSSKFYDFATAISGGTEHIVKLFGPDGVLHHSGVLSVVSFHTLTLDAAIPFDSLYTGTGDTYEIHKKEAGGSLTLLAKGTVQEYKTLLDKTYKVQVTIQGTSGIPQDLFLVKRRNVMNKDGSFTAHDPVHERVIHAAEISQYPSLRSFVFDAKKAGLQWYRNYRFDGWYLTKEEADNAQASLIGQLMGLVIRLATPEALVPTFAVVPGSGEIQIGQQIDLDAVGEKGAVTWGLKQNQSGGYLHSDGTYKAGPNTGTDILTATDAAGNTVTVTFTVSNTFSSTINGEFKWQAS